MCGSAGGVAAAKKSRQAALDRYYKTPNRCETCGKIIEVLEGQRVPEVRKKKYCNRTCWGTAKSKPTAVCETCGGVIQLKPQSRGGYVKRRFCPTCLPLKRAATCRREFRLKGKIGRLTKGELFDRRKNWQSARSSIQYHAQLVYEDSGKPMRCAACGYKAHVDICHLKPVATFPSEATVAEINAEENLEALCPNHHWELDHGLLGARDGGTVPRGAHNAENRVQLPVPLPS